MAVRLWTDGRRIVTARRRKLLAVADLRDRALAGYGPKDAGAFVAQLADGLVERMAGVLAELEDGLDDLEEREATGDGADARDDRHRLLELRRQAIALRRYLSPQRDALGRLATERLPWLDETERLHLREVTDRTTRYVEDLEAARERAAVMQEELASRLSEELNGRMYALSIVAGIFLPLGFVTGLLGINVGGMRGTDSPIAFALVCGLLVGLGIAEIALFRRWRWL